MGKIGQEASLTCDSFAIPLPDKDIIWTFNKNKIVDDERYKVDKAAKVDGIVSTRVIKNTVAIDFGDYECSINNGFGEDTLTVRLHRIGENDKSITKYNVFFEDDSSLVLMVLVSLTVAVLVILAVLLIILQCWRFRGRFRKLRRKLKKKNSGGGSSQSDSDYSSYTGEEEDDMEQSTSFSEGTNDREVEYDYFHLS